jgi:pimeloyl-ACP methyl ester carboxylesterase
MATIGVGDARIGFAVEGPDDGIPLLLFHGTTMDRRAWDMVRPAMTGGYRFVMVEFPGSGESSMPTAPLTVEGLARDGLAVMDEVGVDRFHVAGYSLGAVVALGLAAIAPERVLSATSLCGWATTDARMKFTFDLWKRLIETDRELFMRYAVADGFTAGAIAALEPMLAGVIALGAQELAPGSVAHLALDEDVDISDELKNVTCPTLVIGAVEDRWVDIGHSRQLAAEIPNARLAELPAGHVVIQELPAEVAAQIDAHIAGVASA